MSNGSVESPVKMDTKVILLSNTNKLALLNKSYQHLIQRQAEAETLLHRLHQLNPELGAQFRLKQGVLAKLTLRMIYSPDADIVSDPSACVSPYLAVSYCWHNKTWNVVKAAQPVTDWGVSLPIAKKILKLRDPKDEGVWVDKICIDQKNEDEKKNAIRSMDIIYRTCRRLVIVLEDVQLTKTEEAMGLKYAELYENMCLEVRQRQISGAEKKSFINSYWHVDPSDEPAVVEFAMKMLGARWYSRAWCAHEASVNEHGMVNNPLFLCFGAGNDVLSFEFRFLYCLAVCLYRLEARATPGDNPRNSTPLDLTAILADPSCPTLFQRMARIYRLQSRRHDPQISLLHHLTSISSLRCQEVADLCAIAMNTAGLPLVFDGTIQSLDDIHYISALTVLASGDMNPLVIKNQKLKMQDQSGKSFISWVDRPVNGADQLRIGTPFPESIRSVNRKYIELDLLLIKASPLSISEQCMQKAYSLLEKYALHGKGQTLGVEDPPYTDPPVEKAISLMNKGPVDFKWPESMLASAIECGIDWIRRLPDVLEREANLGAWTHGTFNGFNPVFTDAATDLLSHFGITKENSAEFDNNFLRPAIRFFTCITDDRLRLLFKIPRRIQTRASGDFGITEQITNRSWIAIPQAVSHLPFFHNKTWVIEPYDPTAPEQDVRPSVMESPVPTDWESWADFAPVLTSDFPNRKSQPNELGTWRIRVKQRLLGCQPIVEDVEAVILLKNQRVYGGENYNFDALFEEQKERCKALQKRLQPPKRGEIED